MVPKSFIQDLLCKINIVDFVHQYVSLKKSGSNYFGLCPFHDEKHPSFTVNQERQFFYCFGCSANGNVINFLMQYKGFNFIESIKFLADSIGLSLPQNHDSKYSSKILKEKTLLEILKQANNNYQLELKKSPKAISYLKSRGITGKIANYFQLGWSSHEKQGLLAVFHKKYYNDILIEVGLVIRSSDKNFHSYDRFRNRIMFPIHNIHGNLIAFGGRTICNDIPKYLNSPETSLFSKRKELYGLWQAKQSIQKEKTVIIVEGYIDVIKLVQCGILNVVATLGTSITDYQMEKIIYPDRRVIFCFDGDDAGKRAAKRAMYICLPKLINSIEIRFLFLPISYDPDSFVNEFGVEEFKKKIKESTPLSEFLLHEISYKYNILEAEGRAACLDNAIKIINSIPSTYLRIQIEKSLISLVNINQKEYNDLLYKKDVFTKKQKNEKIKNNYLVYENKSPKDKKILPSIAKKLMILLLKHQNLFQNINEQQIDLIDKHDELKQVKELILFARNNDNCKNIDDFLSLINPLTELYHTLKLLKKDISTEMYLPNPELEWNDSLIYIEIENIKNQMNNLVNKDNLSTEDIELYKALSNRLMIIKK